MNLNIWQMQEAKAKLAELVTLAQNKGPQIITVRGKEAVAVIDMATYIEMIDSKPNIVKFLENSPLKGIEIEFIKDKSTSREIEL